MTHRLRRPIAIARVLVVNAQGRVLVLQRSPGTTQGLRWCLPGGKIDYGETVEDAARRELREETGIEVPSLSFLLYQDSLPETTGAEHYLEFYLTCSADCDPQLNQESADSRWISPAEIDSIDIAFGDDRAIAHFFDACRSEERDSQDGFILRTHSGDDRYPDRAGAPGH